MKQNVKRLFGILLSLMLMLGVLPGVTPVAKASTSYGLWVGGAEVTDTNTSGTGWSFTPAAGTTPDTLTLNNFSYSGSAEGIKYDLISEQPNTLRIELKGTNTIKTTTDRGIFAGPNCNLIFSGTGSLAVSGVNQGIYGSANITFDGGEINAEGTAAGIASGGTITFSGGSVTATGTGETGRGINADGIIEIKKEVTSIVAIGSSSAFSDVGVTNAVFGTGWTDVKGTEGAKIISPSNERLDVNSNFKKVQFPGVHIHSLSYTPSQTGDAVTVSCTSTYGTCDLDPKGVTLTIKAPENLYTDGKAKTATLEGLDAFNAATGKNLKAENIAYYSVDKSAQTKTLMTAAPTAAGDYEAMLHYGLDAQSIISVAYTLSLTPVNITAADQTVSYSADGIAIPVDGMFTIPEGAGAQTYFVGIESDTGKGTFANGVLTVTKCGEFSVGVLTEATSTHDAGSANAKLTVTPAKVTVTAKDQNIYVGDAIPSLKAPVLNTHYTVTGLTGKDTLTTVPILDYQKDGLSVEPGADSAGTWEIVPSGAGAGDNYTISYGKGTLTVSNKTEQTITASDVTATYGDTNQRISASVTKPETGGGAITYKVKDGSGDYIDVNASTGTLTIKKAGTATVIVTAAETATCAAAAKEVTVTINRAVCVPATVTGNICTHDGTEKVLVTVTGEAKGCEMQYALGADATTEPTAGWSKAIPLETDAGTYTVWYKAVGDANHQDTAAAPVTAKILPVSKESLAEVIEDAETYAEEIKADYPDISEELKKAAEKAKGVVSDDNADEAAVKKAMEDLAEALGKAREDKALKEAAKKAAEKQAKADQEAAKKVADQIDALPAADKVTTGDKEAIGAARNAYKALTDDQKKLISAETLKKLTDAEAALETAEKKAKEDQDATETVIALIDALPAAELVKIGDKEAIGSAGEKYKALTDDQKKLISADTLKKLMDAEAALEALQSAAGNNVVFINENEDSAIMGVDTDLIGVQMKELADMDDTPVAEGHTKDVDVRMEVKTLSVAGGESAEMAAIIEEATKISDNALIDYFDIEIEKAITVTDENGNQISSDTIQVKETSKVIEMVFPMAIQSKSDLLVLRNHNRTVQAFTALDEAPSRVDQRRDATFYIEQTLNSINLHIYSSRFSTFAIVTYGDEEVPEPALITEAPTAEEKAEFTGKTQKLITAGTVEGGTMQYALGTDDTTEPETGWSEEIPGLTDVGTYYIWYKAVGDEEHRDSVPQVLKTAIVRTNGLYNDAKEGWVLLKDSEIRTGYTGLYDDAVYGLWFVRNGKIDWAFTGLYNDSAYGWQLIHEGTICRWYNGLWYEQAYGWWLVQDGAVAFGYNGLWNDPNFGWWLIKDGTVDFGYTGLHYEEQYGWWLVQGGAVAFSYNGFVYDPSYGWWLVRGGTVAFDYNGLCYDVNCGWWLIRGGAIDFSYNGLAYDPNCGWWLVKGGAVDFGYNGLAFDPNFGWWLIRGGTVDFGYDGLYGDANYGWWLIRGGTVAFDCNGLCYDVNYGWWLIRSGTVYFEYNGLYDDEAYGRWLIKDGGVAFDYSGEYNDTRYGWCFVKDGKFDWEYVYTGK